MNAYSEGFAIGHGEVRLPGWLMKMDISKGAKLTYNVLAICSRGHDCTWPSQAFLAEKISSSIRTVQRHLLELISHGLIEKGREYAKGKMRRVYRFLTEQDEKVQKFLPSNTTRCRAKSDKMSCSLNKEETIRVNKKSPPTPQSEIQVALAPAPCEVAINGGDLFLELKEEEAEWAEVKDILKSKITSGSFQTWIAPLLFERNGSEVILRGHNNFFCNWVKKNFSTHIETALTTVGISEWKLDVFTAKQQKADSERKEREEKFQKEAARAAAKAAAPLDEDVDALPPDEQFERLYAVYPKARKEARYDAFKAFFKLYRHKMLPKVSLLIAAVNKAKNNNPSWHRDDGRYVPQLSKWLLRRRWLD